MSLLLKHGREQLSWWMSVPCNKSNSLSPGAAIPFNPCGLSLSLGSRTWATGPQGKLQEQRLMRMRVLTELVQGCSFSNTYPVEMSTCCQRQTCHFHAELVQYDQVQDITEKLPNPWLMVFHKIMANNPYQPYCLHLIRRLDGAL